MSQTAKVENFALRHPITKETVFKGVVLPRKPPIDKVLAACLVANRNSVPLETIEFWAHNKAEPHQFGIWRDAHIYPIDLDDRKYHQAGVKSAAEYVAVHLDMVEMTGSGIDYSNLSVGFRKLLEMINKNNATGYLRAMKFSIAYIIREAYELKDDEAYHAELVTKAIDVLESYASVENGAIVRSAEGVEDAFPSLVAVLERSMDQHLTLGRYLRDLWVLGEEPEAIQEKVGFWMGHFDDVEKKLNEGDALLAKLNPRQWSASGVAGITVASDDRFILKAATRSRRWGVRIVVTGPGHTTISSNDLDLTKVNEKLQELEPGTWYFQPRMGAIINGGPQYTAVKPTGLSATHLMMMLQSLATRLPGAKARPAQIEQPKPSQPEKQNHHQRRRGKRHRSKQRSSQGHTSEKTVMQEAMETAQGQGDDK